MPAIRLGRLPDRTPVKLTVSVSPGLHDALVRYAAAYEETYGRAEAVTDLVPAILAAFLDSDRAFIRHQKRSSK